MGWLRPPGGPHVRLGRGCRWLPELGGDEGQRVLCGRMHVVIWGGGRWCCRQGQVVSGMTPILGGHLLSRVQAICRAGLLMLSKARRMSQEETRQAEWVFLACSRASTSRSEVRSVPCLARKSCCDGSSMSSWASQAPRIWCVRMLVQSLRKISSRQIGRRSLMLLSSVVLGRGDKPSLFPEVRYMLDGP